VIYTIRYLKVNKKLLIFEKDLFFERNREDSEIRSSTDRIEKTEEWRAELSIRENVEE